MGLTIDPIDDTITITRGDDQEMRVPIVDYAGNPLNCAGASFRLTVKRSVDDPIASAVFQLTHPAANGIDDTDAATGFVTVLFPRLYLEAMALEYFYDLEMTLADKRRTLLPHIEGAGRLIVPKDVTTPGAVTNPSLPLYEFGGMALGADGTLYQRDTVTGLWWKTTIDNGQENFGGPSATIPF
jgi:hypothetical protein